MGKTKIEWARNVDGSQGQTWNPVRGCSRVSPGCVNCYAERHAARFCNPEGTSEATGEGLPAGPFYLFAKRTPAGPHWTGKVELIDHMLDIPLRVKKPTVWFVNSMSDLFHEALSDADIIRVLDVIRRCHALGHTFQILTKRAGRMRDLCSRLRWDDSGEGRIYVADFGSLLMPLMKHCWLGVSVEDQQRANERIPQLLQTPAAVRFLSVEPLLGPVNIQPWLPIKTDGRFHFADCACLACFRNRTTSQSDDGNTRWIDWVIVGGESGPDARPMDIAWPRSLVRQCQDAGTAVFVKQLGADPREGNAGGSCHNVDCTHPDCGYIKLKLKDKKGGDMAEWPADLRIRQMPEVTHGALR